jgi:spore coat polysaccharide biosynthesis protein SpsF (cytidylyltransferase family)/aryl-alcohol dehydrogenase-like predicted oxidoreductase
MAYRVVIQTRTSSSRLPGKALLPVRGIPASVLAARRAGRDGADVVVATSVAASDDALAGVLCDAGVQVVRGPLDDVLARFVLAAEGLDDGDAVVRLTADNTFPDAAFVGALVDEFRARGEPYLGTWSPLDDLPYGLSAEVFLAGAMRQAAASSTDPADREHVTPSLRRRWAGAPFRPAEAPAGLGRLRCTIDTFDDYQRVLRVFAGVVDPVAVPWLELCARLDALPDAPRAWVPFRVVDGSIHSEMVLGTVQLGMDYGRTNTAGRPPAEEGLRIVRSAVEHGVTHLDTARAYGESETRLGAALEGGWGARVHVVTKLDPLARLPDDADEARVADAVDASVLRSCRELRTASIPTLLLHRAAHRTSHGGAVWARLLALRAEGVIGRLGVSVQTTDEAAEALADPEVKHVQLPFNLLDHRWRRAGIDALLRDRPDVIVHARSVLLQGLLAADSAEVWPRVPGYDPAEVVRTVRALVDELGRAGPLDLCFGYVRAQPWIHGALVGVATHAELMENVALFGRPPLRPEECARVESAFGELPEALLNPALWPRD